MDRRSAPTRNRAAARPRRAGNRDADWPNRIFTNQRSRRLAKLASLARAFLEKLHLRGVELSLSLVTDAQIRRLNRQWRGKDQPTDVLSFPAGGSPIPGHRPLGDVVLSVDTARRAAKAHGTTLDGELALYLAHGLLHLLGHDHHTKAGARRMAREERRLLGHAGLLGRSDEL
jgi:probable rRNA maturation factor